MNLITKCIIFSFFIVSQISLLGCGAKYAKLPESTLTNSIQSPGSVEAAVRKAVQKASEKAAEATSELAQKARREAAEKAQMLFLTAQNKMLDGIIGLGVILDKKQMTVVQDNRGTRNNDISNETQAKGRS